jgi:hypothetical protein
MRRIVLCLALAFVSMLANHSLFAGGLNDTQIRQRIIQCHCLFGYPVTRVRVRIA